MKPEEMAEARRRGNPDPLPYKTSHFRAGFPFAEQHGSITGTSAFPPTGWMENSVYEPRWFTPDDYADYLAAQHRIAVARSARSLR